MSAQGSDNEENVDENASAVSVPSEKPVYDEDNPEPPKVVLEAKNIKEGLALLKRTPDGASYAFSTLTIEEPETPFEVMGDDIKEYKNLLNVSVAKNQFREVDALCDLPYVMNLNISENKIQNIDWMATPNSMQYLQVMNAEKNAIRILGDFGQPRLRKLVLNDNKIEDITAFKGVTSHMRFLSLANNRIRDLSVFANMPELEELYVSGNKLTSFAELENMPALRVLHMRNNRFKEVEDIFSAPCLEYINLRDNAKMEKANGLEKLAGFEVLKKANFQGCPCADGDDFKNDLLIRTGFDLLEKINKEEVTEEDRLAAKQLQTDREAEAEEKRKAEEEAAAEAAANAEGQEEGEEENNE